MQKCSLRYDQESFGDVAFTCIIYLRTKILYKIGLCQLQEMLQAKQLLCSCGLRKRNVNSFWTVNFYKMQISIKRIFSHFRMKPTSGINSGQNKRIKVFPVNNTCSTQSIDRYGNDNCTGVESFQVAFTTFFRCSKAL